MPGTWVRRKHGKMMRYCLKYLSHSHCPGAQELQDFLETEISRNLTCLSDCLRPQANRSGTSAHALDSSKLGLAGGHWRERKSV